MKTGLPSLQELAAIPPSGAPRGWQVVSASVRGVHHEKAGLPCQDACQSRVAAGNVLFAAAADGLSSAAQSEIGSAVATQVAVDTLSAAGPLPEDPCNVKAWETYMTEALESVLSAVECEADRHKIPVRELATTLILVVATPRGTVAVQVGDGAVVIEDRENNLIALTAPPSGEYVNETDCLASSNVIQVAQGRYWPVAPRSIAIFTDGLQRLALQLPKAHPHPAFFSPLFKFVSETKDHPTANEELKAFLESPRMREQADDDLTLLLAHMPEIEA